MADGGQFLKCAKTSCVPVQELSLRLRRLKTCVSFRMQAHEPSNCTEISHGSLILNWIKRLQTICKSTQCLAIRVFFQSQLVAVGPEATLVPSGVF